MPKRFSIPAFEVEEGERLTVSASATGENVTWIVSLRCGELSVSGYLTQELLDDGQFDARQHFMEQLRQKIDDL